jgi:polyisoprenoid-binding protein YceI
MRKYLTVITALVAASFTGIMLQDWKIGNGYTIRFDGKYAHGSFSNLAGSIAFDPEHLGEAKFDVTVDVASIDTGIELKNKHARSDKWFDAEKYPAIRFISSQVSRTDTGFVVRGDLELKGIKKEIRIPFGFRQMPERSVFYGRFKVNRADFGIGKTNGKESDSTSVEVMVPVMPN